MDDLNAQLGRTAEPEKKKKGCLFFGCLTTIILFVLVPVGLYFVMRFGMQQLVTDYGSGERTNIPIVEATADEGRATLDRVDSFFKNAAEGTATAPLELSARDLNVMMLADDELAPLAQFVHFDLKDNYVTATGSFALDDIGFKGKYLNFDASLRPVVVAGQLSLALSSLTLKGVPIPLERLGKVQETDLLADLAKDPQYAEKLRSVEKVEIKGGKLTLFPKVRERKQQGAATPGASPI